MSEVPAGIGARVRYWRLRRSMSQQAVADLAGLSRSQVAMIETGRRALDRRSQIAALAAALRVATDDLIGEVIPAGDERLAVAQAALPALRLALLGSTLDEPADVEPRPLAQLQAETEQVDRLLQNSDYAAAAGLLPDLLTELKAAAARGTRSQRRAALRLLVDAAHAAFYTLKDLGDPSSAYMAAEQVRQAGELAGDRAAAGLGAFLTAHALLPVGAHQRAQRVADRAADEMADATGPELEVRGMLHLTAGLALVWAGHHDDADERVAEAGRLASRTEDTNAYGLAFGEPNVALWRMAMAVERGEGGRAVEIGRDVPVAGLQRGRQAAYWMDMGRGLAQAGRDGQALEALRRAENIAPQQVRTSPMVRDVVAGMVRRARAAASGGDLLGFAHRLGVA